MPNFEEKFSQAFSELTGQGPKSRQRSSSRVLVGVSGGVDSMVLLSCLWRLGKKTVVAHFNHRLRGRESGQDQRFVQGICQKWELDFESEAADVRAFAKIQKQSLEACARDLRYNFLVRAAKKWRCSAILTAHHADDQVETVLHNLLRGSGTAGLSGMKPASLVQGRTLLRPLLGIWRREILAFAEEKAIPFREDSSNQLLFATRNRLRHSLLPMLEEVYGRSIKPSLWRAAEILREEDAFLEAYTAEILQDHHDKLSVRIVAQLHPALQRRVLLAWLKSHDVKNLSFELIEQARNLAQGKGARMNLADSRQLCRRAGQLFIRPIP
ncbi:MAG: tRNA lysidine(34) synthetase TilS [Verrucomicrobiales bacterium]